MVAQPHRIADATQQWVCIGGSAYLRLPLGSYRVEQQGRGVTVLPQDQRSLDAIRREPPMTTELAEIAAHLGMRVSAAPKPVPESTPQPTVRSKAIRPVDITEMIGQDRVRVQMMLAAQAAMAEREAGNLDAMPPHMLLSGPSGTGKTTLAKILASTIGGQLVETIASAVDDVKTLARELAKLQDNDVFFIDEIHGLHRPPQELLYTAMEDGAISMRTGQGVDVKTTRVQLNKFVLVGATTVQGKLEAPMIARFGLVGKLVYYRDDELAQIILNRAEKLSTKIDEDAAILLATRSKGTARIATRLLDQCRGYVVGMQRSTEAVITVEAAEKTLSLHDIDALGLEMDERDVLAALCNPEHNGRPIGIEPLAQLCGMEEITVKELEPLLLRLKLMMRTSRGRKPTKLAYEHLGIDPPADAGFDIA
jgi:Holliday junction DNA helicase RuvB